MKYRGVCDLTTAKTWEEMHKILNHEAIDVLKKVYEDPDDIDLFVGATVSMCVLFNSSRTTFIKLQLAD